MKLAAIDIGSNAIRFQVIRVIRLGDSVSFKKLEYIRFPLRLGEDVFNTGMISDHTLARFEKLMRTFKLLLELYEVEGYIAAATSAMREAKNGKQIIHHIADTFGLHIEVITGKEEAEVLSQAIVPFLDERAYIHIDVGGGSTELNLYRERERVSSKSFRMGSVRQLPEKKRLAVFQEAEEWLKASLPETAGQVIAVGTGGNIRKLFQFSNFQQSGSITLTELTALKAYVNAYNLDERLNLLKMNPDRADVIIPAAEIYIEVMRRSGAERILAPNVGLKDGMLYQLYEKVTGEAIGKVEFLDQL